MARVEILDCYPTLEKVEENWKKRGKEVGRMDDGGIAITEGSTVIQVVAEHPDTARRRVKWIDPATGHELRRTKKGKGNGLWDEKDKVWYHPYHKRRL